MSGKLIQKIVVDTKDLDANKDESLGEYIFLTVIYSKTFINNLKNKVLDSNADIGFAFDADSDRVGIIDNESNYIESPYAFCIIADHVLDIKNRRNVSTTVSMTSMIDEIVKKYDVECFRTKVGFKYVAPNMEKNNSILGGEESGGYSYSEHLLERDGIASSLLILEKLIM